MTLAGQGLKEMLYTDTQGTEIPHVNYDILVPVFTEPQISVRFALTPK